MSRIVLSGSSGFVGQNLVRALRGRHDLLLLDDPPKLDVRDFEQLEKSVDGADVAIHLAGLNSIEESRRHPTSYFHVNLTGTLNMLELCRRKEIKSFLFASTAAVYRSQDEKSSETSTVNINNPYAASKYCSEVWAKVYAENYGLSISGFRFFNLFGPHQLNRALIPTIAYQALTKEVVRLGNTDISRDFLYVEDAVSLLVAAIDTKTAYSGCNIFNVGSGKLHSIGDAVNRIENILNRKLIVDSNQTLRSGMTESPKLWADIEKAYGFFGWRPTIGFDEGLKNTMLWYKAHLSELTEVFV